MRSTGFLGVSLSLRKNRSPCFTVFRHGSFYKGKRIQFNNLALPQLCHRNASPSALIGERVSDKVAAAAGSWAAGSLPGDQAFHATLWGRHGITDLGAVGTDQCAEALSVNSSDQVVGISHPYCGAVEATAFLWERGGPVIDLNVFVPPGSDVHLRAGVTINDRGEIAVSAATPEGDRHAVLLIPCDNEPVGSDGCQGPAQRISVSSRTGTATSTQTKLNPRDLLRGYAAESHRYATRGGRR